MRARWLPLTVLLVACGGASSGGSTGAHVGGDPNATNPAMRFVQDGRAIGVLGADGRVTLEGGQVIGTVFSNGQVVDHEGHNVLALTSGGNIVFSSVQREPMRITPEGALLIEPGSLLEVDAEGNFRMGDDLVGIFIEGYDPAHRDTAYLAWLALTFAPIPWRRSLAAEPRENLEVMYTALAAFVDENHRLPAPGPATPPTIVCGQTGQWPASPPGGFGEIGVSIEAPIRYTYELQVRGDEVVLTARGDLDCDGTFGRFALHARLADGALTREPLLRVTDELE